MFKKSLMFFCLFLCCANIAYGDCVFSQPEDKSPSDEDIFLTDPQDYKNGKPDALICGGDYCARNTYVYITNNHWLESSKADSGTPIYTCETIGNDKWQRVGNAPDCTADADKTNEIYINTPKIKNKKYYYQTEIEPGVYIGLCAEPDADKDTNKEGKYDLNSVIKNGGYLEPVSLVPFTEPEVFDLPADDKIKGEGTTGFACTPERQGNYYVFDDTLSYYKCDLNGSWKREGYVRPCYTIDEWTGIDLPVPSGLTEIRNDNNYFKIYKKTDINSVNGYTGVYEYSDNIKDMCQWCGSGLYGVPENTNGTDVFCIQNEQQAWCEFAKIKNNANVEWDNDNIKCKCIGYDADKEWDETEHVCKPKSGSEEDSATKDQEKEQQQQKDCATLYGATGQKEALECCKLEKAGKADMRFGADKTTFKTCDCKDNKKWNKKNFTCDAVSATGETSLEQYNAAKAVVDKFFAESDKQASGWKDASGKVNAKRVASDVTAGVVLGTVGGVVSGVVIKKKQIEKGFEVLHCDVGGQNMANWGDTFSIGLQR